MLFEQFLNGLMLGSIYALVAVGYTLVFGVLNLLNFAHGEVFMAAGFFSFFLTLQMGFPLIIAFIFGIVIGSIIGIVLEVSCFEIVKKETPEAPLIATIGFGMILSHLISGVLGSEPLFLPSKLKLPNVTIGNVVISGEQLLALLVSLITMILLTLLIWRTKQGRAMRGLSESLIIPQLLGVNIRRIIIFSFAICSALAGLASIMWGLRFGNIDPFIGGSVAVKGIAVMVIGGLGNVGGALIAGLLTGVVEVMGWAYISSGYADIIPWLLLIFVVLIKPTGLFGSRVREGM